MRHGAPGRIRTCNPRLRRPVLYPLSYGRYSFEVYWSGQQDLNLRPSAPKADALPDCAMPRACTQGGHLIRPRAARREPRLERPGKLVRESASPRSQRTPVTAKILDGKAVAQQIRDELGPRVARVRERLGRPPALS